MNQTLSGGKFAFRHNKENKQLVMYLFKDQEPRNVFSLFISSHLDFLQSKTLIQMEIKKIEVSLALKDYNFFRYGVDTVDELHSFYPIGRKSRKW